MDANGQRFWMALGGAGWQALPASPLDVRADHLRLASESDVATYPETPAQAEARLQVVPQARDTFGCRAFFDVATLTIRGTGARPDSASILGVPAGVTDLALANDGNLYVAVGGTVVGHDLRNRFVDATAALPGFSAWRLAAAPAGGAWVLDRIHKTLARLTGRLWPAPRPGTPPPDAFLPVAENPDPLRLLPVTMPWGAPAEDPIALACSPGGRLAVLVWTAAGPGLRLVDDTAATAPFIGLREISRPFSVAWLSEERLAVVAAGVAEALVYEIPAGGPGLPAAVTPVGDIHPLRDHDGGPLLHGVSLPVEYLANQPTAADPTHVIQRPLVAASLPAYANSGRGLRPTPFDSGTAGTTWHRLYGEAEIPPDTGFTVYLAASDSEEDPTAITSDADWHPHHFGTCPAARPAEPRASWVPAPSELPGQQGFLEDPPAKDRNGLFTVLIQRSNRPVRTLRGRFLHLRIELRGTLRSTPCVHALRAYGPRFSYVDQYLPSLYRETVLGAEADLVTPDRPATAADFLGRFVANCEGVFTPLEDKIAAAWLLTDPRTTPDAAVDWLGSWIGVVFESWYPPARRRASLSNAPRLFRSRGTLSGLKLALDLVTGGGIGAGRVVVLEDFWFRRTLQTILGLKLDRVDDPLLGGPLVSGNSKIGRTLILSEEGFARKFLALFDASIQLKTADQQVVDEFFAALAFRATVIVHEETAPNELKLIERVAALESPAHVQVRVRPASQDFLVGLAALVGADTYLRPPPPPTPVEVDKTQIGDGSHLLRPPSLDPRLEGAPS